MSLSRVVRRVLGREVPAEPDHDTPAELDSTITALLAAPRRDPLDPPRFNVFLPDHWDGKEIPAGECGYCHQPVGSYSQMSDLTARRFASYSDRHVAPTRPLRAHPCGHDQPGPVVFNGLLSPTYAGPRITERNHP